MAKVSFEEYDTHQKYVYRSVDELMTAMMYNPDIATPDLDAAIWHVRLGSEILTPGAVSTRDLNTPICTFEDLLLLLNIDY